VLTVYAGNDTVTDEVMGHAIALSRFYLGEALRLSNAASVSRVIADAERLRVWLLESWQEPFISAPDVAQHGPSALRVTNYAKRLLAILQKHGWLVPMAGGAMIGDKKRREAWRIYGR